MIRPLRTPMKQRTNRSSAGLGGERIGAVQYLNSRPLIYGLGDSLDFDLPSRLADRLASDDLDAALIPSIELFQRLDTPLAKSSRREHHWSAKNAGSYHVVSNAVSYTHLTLPTMS